MSLATLALYNQPEYSDVMVRFSDRTVYCHKLILCTNSDYFKKLCGPGSHFAVSYAASPVLSSLRCSKQSRDALYFAVWKRRSVRSVDCTLKLIEL